MLSLENVSAGYKDTPVISHISAEFTPGKIYALLGPNGCGKSTLLRTIAQLQPVISGQINYQGQSISRLTNRHRAKVFAMLSQQNPIPEGINVRQLVEFGRTPHQRFFAKLTATDQHIIEQSMQWCELDETLIHKPLSDLSGGQRQRAWLAMALAQQSQYLLLDEPTTYLDLKHQIKLMNILNTLKEKGKTIICVLHDLNQASHYCDELMILNNAQLYTQGPPDKVMTSQMLENVFEIKATISRNEQSNTPMVILP
ncbi:ABC transporter ATP-binding protein [Celerinatantimonas diazotrophica]|uniref:Iron complex transport system ATP-binding protein n=1 Tax=Celerinatantimonas diazotrophica TaxID=412034 RepID=A0A4R1J877_9GAMM|nr:ATP-binding cassette domain-containing protein [Celerinatantimonas diazotrophica]TCK46543.1 iron complex transport system ATP-binding protein [Celerinatantimonas diazotrophica]CAG9296593.1 Fe(3+) dicitrate transport ATP-binding protein FecE [Celerinatantimonas diazotrophica]